MFSNGQFSNHINRHKITYAWLVILLLVFTATISITLAFFYHQDWATNSIGTSGAVRISAVGDGNANIEDIGDNCRLVVTLDDYYDNLVIPNAPLTLTSNCKVTYSTTNPLLRASLKLEFIDADLGLAVTNNDTINGYSSEMIGDLHNIITANGWYLYNGYYYYVGTDATLDGGNTILKEIEFEETQDTIVPFVNQSIRVPSSITSEYSGYKLKFTIIFQGIQNFIPDDAGQKVSNTITHSLLIFENFADWEENQEEFVYELTEDGKGIYFGYWPQTIKASNVTITSTTPDADGYYKGSDGERYAKLTTEYSSIWTGVNGQCIANKMNVASDGTVMNSGETYYFKVEKLRWTILSRDGNNKATILCDSIIQGQQYQPHRTRQNSDFFVTDSDGNILLDEDGNQVYANNYKYSALRNFLTTTFYNTAFSSMQKAIIQQIEVDNSVSSTAHDKNPYVCENTNDKVWAMSYGEVIEEVGSISRQDDLYLNPQKYVGNNMNLFVKPTTDYARATGTYTFTQEYCEYKDISPYKLLYNMNALDDDSTEDMTFDDCSDVQKMLLTQVYSSGAWWFRSPSAGLSYCVYGAYYSGQSGNGTADYMNGAVPALQIQL